MSEPNAKNEVTLEIDRLSYGPYGIGRVDGRVVMVPHTAPGDRIVTRVVEEKGRFSIAELVRVISPSPARRTPPCPYVGKCGGCAWQHLNYETQLKAKQQSVDDALKRIGKLSGYDLRPIIGIADEFHYRRRIRLQAGPANKLGFYGASSHHLVEIDSCLIAEEQLNTAIETLRRWAPGMNTAIEHVEIVTGDEANQTVVAARAVNGFIPRDEPACANLIAMDSGIQGLIISGRDWRKFWGEPRITVGLRSDLKFTVDADVFTQVNPAGNRRILDELLTAGDFQTGDRVLELFCGAGNFTLAIARQTEAVFAVEGHRPSIANGKLNAQKNGIENIRWFCAPVPKAVAELKRKRERFSKIVLDPPRAGAKGIEADVAALGAAKILYVSCNPATLARDVAALAKLGYKLATVQPIDLFPQTFHIETLAVLER
jgi:23S rRNA (uracil1939-C5)-methyltransferase